MTSRVFLSLGSNVGDRAAHLRVGVEIVVGAEAHRVSRVYQSEPVGGVSQDDFWNLVVEITTTMSPWAILERAHAAETARGRRRDVRWGPRTLDVDVVWVDGFESGDPELIVPHPRAFERAFVLVPWRELAPDLVSQDDVERSFGRVAVLDTLESLQ